MLYNFNNRRIGACVSSALAAYRKLVPMTRNRQEHLASTRFDPDKFDLEMTVEEEYVDAQIKRRKV